MRVRIGLLVGYAPIAKLFDAYWLARDCAPDISAVLQHLEFPIEIANLSLLPKCGGTLNAIYYSAYALK